MNKKSLAILMGSVSLFCLLLSVCGCSSSGDDPAAELTNQPGGNSAGGPSTFVAGEKPVWSVDFSGNEPSPSWVAPNPADYESSMIIMVKLQDELVRYSTDDDRMTVLIDDECRAIPSRRIVYDDGTVYFVLNIQGNHNDRDVRFSLCYYCAALHQLFTITGQETFVTELTYGVDEDFEPSMLKGCKRYPVQNTLTVSMPPSAPFTSAEGDIVGVFVGDQCRGVGSVGKAFTVYRTSAQESLQLRYYSTQQKGTYTQSQAVAIGETETKTITINF